MSKPVLGFIGLGRMGSPMARRLIGAGYSVVVCDPVAAAVEALVARGAQKAANGAELASKADIVFASLPTPDVVQKVALGDDGLIQGSRAKIVVDLSTTGPQTSQRVAQALAAKNITLLDSPVSGGVAGAEKGTLTLMVAGSREAYEEVEVLLHHLGRIYYCGPKAGNGQTLKLANNLMSVAAMAVCCEALVMGAKAGLDPEVMMEVINVSSGRSGASQDKIPKHILPRTFDFGFSTALSHKDTRLCCEEAEAMGVPMIMGNAVRQILTMTKSQFGPDADFTNMIRLMEGWAGVEVRPTDQA